MAVSVPLLEATRTNSPAGHLAGEHTQGDNHSSMIAMDWIKTLTPKMRSCIKLGSIEPCVNKAVLHLGHLKSQLDEESRRPVELASVAEVDRTRDFFKQAAESANPKSILVHREPGATADSGLTSRLIIEGVATGTPQNKLCTFPTIEVSNLSSAE